MVFSSGAVVEVARVSAEAWQLCNPEQLSSGDILNLLCCIPLQHLRSLALRVFSFFCFPPPSHLYRRRQRINRRRAYYNGYYYDSSSSDSSSLDDDSEDDDDVGGYASHSD